YDIYGREPLKYLPFASNFVYGSVSINDGSLKRNPLGEQQVYMSGQYGAQGETVYYGQTVFESSPLGRPEKVMAPGNSWAGSGRGVETKYWNNTNADNVKVWKCENVAGGFGTYSLHTYNSGVYPAGQLYKTVVADEHGKQVIEFKDKDGRVILKKVQLTAAADNGSGSDHPGWLCTYYIYDKLNNLRCVIQPEGVKALTTGSWQLTTDLLDEQCFRYEYDARNRMIRKKVPGAGEVYMVYDKLDRLVMTQDANQRAQGKWMVTKYDELSRPVETGLWTNSTPFETHLSNGYGSTGYPTTASGYEVLTVTHYDDYANLPAGLSSSYLSTWNGYFSATSNTAWPYPQ
ncbi:MAG: hypothetical protein JNM88_11310, partial [Chitinophagaceae bacterium]|nr:hypothetical protein [Chitinophagaceae bacterium]